MSVDRDFIVTMDVRTGTTASGNSRTKQVVERVTASDGLAAAKAAMRLYSAAVTEVQPAWEEAPLFDAGTFDEDTGEIRDPSGPDGPPEPGTPGGPDGPPVE